MNADFERRDVVPDDAIFCNSDAECAEAAVSGIPFIPIAGELAHALGAGSVLISAGQQCVILSIDQILIKATSTSGEIFHFNAISDLTFGSYWHGDWLDRGTRGLPACTSWGWCFGLSASRNCYVVAAAIESSAKDAKRDSSASPVAASVTTNESHLGGPIVADCGWSCAR